MGITSLIKKYILPNEIDFIGLLNEQVGAIHKMIEDLHECFITQNDTNCKSIIDDEHKTEELKARNMKQLLNAFITPIDRESIYRTITQLDWVAITIYDFVLETKAYDVHDLNRYKEIFDLIYKASKKLQEGFGALSDKKYISVSLLADETRDICYKIGDEYINQMVILSKSNNHQEAFIHREILLQLKEIGKRLHVCANTMQDIVIKMD